VVIILQINRGEIEGTLKKMNPVSRQCKREENKKRMTVHDPECVDNYINNINGSIVNLPSQCPMLPDSSSSHLYGHTSVQYNTFIFNHKSREACIVNHTNAMNTKIFVRMKEKSEPASIQCMGFK
jgi:hypothetical protein